MSEEALSLCRDVVDLTKMRMLGSGLNNTYPTLKFYTVILSSLNKVFSDCGSAATDGRSLFIDPKFITGHDELYINSYISNLKEKIQNKFEGMRPDEVAGEIARAEKNARIWLSKKSILEVAFVLSHEARHIIGATFSRGEPYGDAYRKLVNIASDYQINNRLCYEMFKGDISLMNKIIPLTTCLYVSSKYFDIKNGDYIEWTMEEILEDLLVEHKEEEGCFVLDTHLPWDDHSVENAKRSIINAVKSEIGKAPSDVKKQVDDWLDPKIVWHKYLDRNMKSLMKYDFDYAIPCESSWSESHILREMGYLDDKSYVINPSQGDESTLEVVIVFDTSGSIFCDDALVKTLCGELSGILSQFQNAKVHIMCFDTNIHNYKVYETMSVCDIKDYELTGGGGSSIVHLKKFMKDNNIPKKNVVVFTDMCIRINWEDYADFRNLTWIVFNNKQVEIPYGFKINY